MSWRTTGLILMLRNIGRSLGLNRVIATYLREAGYEARYDNLFSGSLRLGDCVWDVGANVGYYTKIFSGRVGAAGRVFAFEPSPTNFARLSENCAALSNAIFLHAGLGMEDSTLHFQQGADDLGATSRIVEGSVGDILINVRSGASVIHSGDALIPNAIKIDVEGYEYEVLAGLGDFLKVRDLHLIGIEVHFEILKDRGYLRVPEKIEEILASEGFSISWPDASHIIAVRSP